MQLDWHDMVMSIPDCWPTPNVPGGMEEEPFRFGSHSETEPILHLTDSTGEASVDAA